MLTTQLFTEHADPMTSYDKYVNYRTHQDSEWSAENGLIFKNDKLKYITFSSKRKINDKSYLIRSNGKLIAEEANVKLLTSTKISRGSAM